jgi:hypothetical protein
MEGKMKKFSDEELVRIRNLLPVRWVIEVLLQLPCGEVEGVYRFSCPKCNESQTGLNPNTNLARCFSCEKNFNPIDLVMTDRKLSFVSSVKWLLEQERIAKQGIKPTTVNLTQELSQLLSKARSFPTLASPRNNI